MPTREYKNPDTMSRPAGYTHVVKVDKTVYIAGQVSVSADVGAVRQVRDEVHQGSNPPTSTLLVVSALANPDFMAEIEAIAVVE
jgi:enamine deaminase RidA (YjgF/YER057c/UK114 family)